MFDDFLEFNNIAVMVRRTGMMIYDFNFRRYFDCSSILHQTDKPVLLRVGAIDDFDSI